MEITDNGGGIGSGPPSAGGLGLTNMRKRAEGLDGTFEVVQPEAGGTTIVWQVPVLSDRAGRADH